MKKIFILLSVPTLLCAMDPNNEQIVSLLKHITQQNAEQLALLTRIDRTEKMRFIHSILEANKGSGDNDIGIAGHHSSTFGRDVKDDLIKGVGRFAQEVIDQEGFVEK